MTTPQPDETQAPAILKVLAHDLRWRLLKALSRGDCRVQQLASLTGEPANLVSYHLRQLRDLRLVAERRSAADGRDVYYSLDLPRLHALYAEAGIRLHPAFQTPELVDDLTPFLARRLEILPPAHQGTNSIGAASVQPVKSEQAHPVHELPGATLSLGSDAPVRILFLCTHNSARSQMAEGILRQVSRGRFEVFSAGSEPTSVHTEAIHVLSEMGIDIRNQQAKNLEEFRGQTFSYVITLCDHLTETCPKFNGQPSYMHWSFPDPALILANDEARTKAFVQTALQLFTRIRYLIPLIEHERQTAA